MRWLLGAKPSPYLYVKAKNSRVNRAKGALSRASAQSLKMAEVISPMEVDNDGNASRNFKGKNVVVSAGTDSKTTPWVEKHRPQSLSDVAAHRDIVETS